MKRNCNLFTSFNKRFTYLFLIGITIFFGLASRKYSQALWPFFSENAGDVLWASMVYFGFRFLLVHKSLRTAIIASVVFSFGIEFCQLYQASWINEIRNTRLGSLILGHGFLFVDLIRYTIGILLAMLLDKAIFQLKKP